VVLALSPLPRHSLIWESWTKKDTFRLVIWKVCKNWYVQISGLNIPRRVAMMACVCGGTNAYWCSYSRTHMLSRQLAYWRPQSLQHITGSGPSGEWGTGGKLPCASQRLGAPPSLKNIKYTRMHHFKKKKSRIFSPDGPRENVSPGPTVALDRPAQVMCSRPSLQTWISWPQYIN